MIRICTLLFAMAVTSCNNPITEPGAGVSVQDQKVLALKQKKVRDLPPELSEISGITFLSDSVLVAVQDEEGILFFFDMARNRIIRQQVFAGPGDYEGLTRAGDDMYVITSEGVLYQIADFRSPDPVIKTFQTPLNSKNDVEGLAYEAKRNRLLIAPKEHGLEKDETRKDIYAFDLESMSFRTHPAYSIRLSEIESHFHGDPLEESSKKFLKVLGNQNMNKVFRSSDLTVSGKTGEIYVLSSINGLVAVLSPDNRLNRIIQFAGPEFKQPEGIALDSKGMLYISNEGAKSRIGNIIEMTNEN